jgi:murein DD-endopeptidase MepM/ murein hydrolase activator NlpD
VTTGRGQRALPLLALIAAFGAGVLVDGWLRTYGPPQPAQAAAKPSEPPVNRLATPAPVGRVGDRAGQPKMAAPPAVPTAALPAPRLLRVPIDGMSIEPFRGGFSEPRGSRQHEAIDIVAPRGTPVHAVQDGTIAKLFLSAPGGTTIYQFDPDERLCFYYAHLERYADGLHDGQHVSQGEVIGYVGTSGNAPPDAPHLHFAIFELNEDRKWWQGRPLDPYLMFREKG